MIMRFALRCRFRIGILLDRSRFQRLSLILWFWTGGPIVGYMLEFPCLVNEQCTYSRPSRMTRMKRFSRHFSPSLFILSAHSWALDLPSNASFSPLSTTFKPRSLS
jgi:hypothetical protein